MIIKYISFLLGLIWSYSFIKTQSIFTNKTALLFKLFISKVSWITFVIACYSDPGLQVCREATDKPVFGIQECGVLAAMAQGDRFGVIALQEDSIRRHLTYLKEMGVIGRFAKESAANLSVEE